MYVSCIRGQPETGSGQIRLGAVSKAGRSCRGVVCFVAGSGCTITSYHTGKISVDVCIFVLKFVTAEQVKIFGRSVKGSLYPRLHIGYFSS